MKIAAVGTASSVMGFKALGIDVFVVPRPEEAAAVWKTLDPDQYAVIFVTEDLIEQFAEQIEMYSRVTFPVVTLIPPVAGSGGSGVARLKALVEKAVGTDLSVAKG